MSAAQKVTVVNHMDGTIHVHDANCRDLQNLSRYGMINGKWSYEATTQREIAIDSYADQIDEGSMDIEMAISEHQFFPCITLDQNLSPELQAQTDQYAIDQEMY